MAVGRARLQDANTRELFEDSQSPIKPAAGVCVRVCEGRKGAGPQWSRKLTEAAAADGLRRHRSASTQARIWPNSPGSLIYDLPIGRVGPRARRGLQRERWTDRARAGPGAELGATTSLAAIDAATRRSREAIELLCPSGSRAQQVNDAVIKGGRGPGALELENWLGARDDVIHKHGPSFHQTKSHLASSDLGESPGSPISDRELLTEERNAVCPEGPLEVLVTLRSKGSLSCRARRHVCSTPSGRLTKRYTNLWPCTFWMMFFW